MSTTTPPPAAPDSEPASPPSLPGVALWSDSDPPVAAPKPATFAGLVAKPVDNAIPTIGHIGRYALKYRLGEGGLGTVFAAHDPLLSRLIAVKTLNVQVPAAERESFNTLFINEARAAGGLSHPHIVTVFDAGISDDRAYIAMELLKGRDLRQLRQEGWRATPAQAALIVRRVADALAFAHSRGVIHRDIKPANIFMVGRTQPRVLDFGIARVAHRQETVDPHSGAGSPYYMAPEQMRRETADRRADVFSLGVVLYELLTDAKPFHGESLEQIREAVLHHEPPLANKVDPSVPKALAAIAARAMAKDPEQRFRSARSFARELRQWLDENAAAPEAEAVATAVAPAPGSRRRLQIAIGAAAAVLVAGAALWAVGPSRSSTSGTATATAPANSPPRDAGAVHAVPEGAVVATAAPITPVDADPARSAASGMAPTSAATDVIAPAADAVSTAAAPSGTTTSTTATSPPANSTMATGATTVAVGATTEPTVASSDASAATATPAKLRPAALAGATPTAAPAAPRESAKERRARELHERELRESEARIASAAKLVAPATGTVKIAISPWGQVEVDGTSSGVAPPITELTLTEGRHQIVVRNGDFAPYTTTVNVSAGQSTTLRYKFGS